MAVTVIGFSKSVFEETNVITLSEWYHTRWNQHQESAQGAAVQRAEELVV
jgi:hypothetical protein